MARELICVDHIASNDRAGRTGAYVHIFVSFQPGEYILRGETPGEIQQPMDSRSVSRSISISVWFCHPRDNGRPALNQVSGSA